MLTMDMLSQGFMVLVAIELLYVVFLFFTGKGDLGMLMVGRLALLDWALAFIGIGLLLIQGQSTVALNALDAGRLSEALMQFVFITLVFIGTAISAFLFIYVGVLRE
jgi:hypothetical protein